MVKIDYETLIELEDYIQELDQTVGLKPEVLKEFERAISKKRKELKNSESSKQGRDLPSLADMERFASTSDNESRTDHGDTKQITGTVRSASTPETKEDWYCPICKSFVSGESVTFEEYHDLCGTYIGK